MREPKILAVVVVPMVPTCPGCGMRITIVAGNNAMPQKDDWNVCSRCLAVLRFTGDGFTSRLATADELETDPHLAPENRDFLRQCYAAHASRRTGTSA